MQTLELAWNEKKQPLEAIGFAILLLVVVGRNLPSTLFLHSYFRPFSRIFLSASSGNPVRLIIPRVTGSM